MSRWIMVVGDGTDGGGSGHSAQMGDMTHDSYIMGGVVVIRGNHSGCFEGILSLVLSFILIPVLLLVLKPHETNFRTISMAGHGKLSEFE